MYALPRPSFKRLVSKTTAKLASVDEAVVAAQHNLVCAFRSDRFQFYCGFIAVAESTLTVDEWVSIVGVTSRSVDLSRWAAFS